jgi:hypothetical protein
VAQRIRELGSEPAAGNPTDFREIVSNDLSRWKTVATEAKIERI